MKRLAIIVFSLLGGAGWATAHPTTGRNCQPPVVLARVSIPDGNLSLADLLAPETCAQLRESASRVRLGVAPLPGSPRVLDGADVRPLLERLAASVDRDASPFPIPARIVIQRQAEPGQAEKVGVKWGLPGQPREALAPNPGELLVKPGETATLVWQGGGISVQLPVVCLDAGRAGEFVRARVKNEPRILRAQVAGKDFLRITSER